MKKTIIAFTAGLLLCTGAALHAEDADGDSVIVPLHDASRPPTIRIHLLTGGITVRGEDRKDIAVESKSRRRSDSREPPLPSPRSDGMRRLELPGANGLDIVEDNNVVTIKSDMSMRGGDLVIAVPRHASLQLKCLNGGDISVDDVVGEIEADNLNGAVHLKNVAGSVIASSLNGAVTADLSGVDPTKPMLFSTMNGQIDVTLPADVKANVSLKTDNGEILSDFDVKLDTKASTTQEGGRRSDGTYHLRLDKTLHGSINGGGPEYKFRSFNGQILIHKRK